MDDLLLALLEGLVELFCEVVLQALFEIAAEMAREGFDAWQRRKPSPGPGTAGLLLWGAAAGALSSWLVPHRLFARGLIPGLSMLLAPLLAGVVMHWFGIWRRAQGRAPSTLATYRGGALFAFAMALIRWLIVGLK